MTFAVMACMNGADGDMRAEKGRGERERRGKRAIQATLRPIMKKFTLSSLVKLHELSIIFRRVPVRAVTVNPARERN